MDRTTFENIVEGTFDRLPPQFRNVIDNVGVVVEDYPDDELVRKLRLRSNRDLPQEWPRAQRHRLQRGQAYLKRMR